MAIKDPPVTLTELSEAIGRDERYIKNNWRKLHERHGLPRKLAIGWLWPRLALEAFLQGYQHEQPTPDAPVPVEAIAANQNASLSARYAGGRI